MKKKLIIHFGIHRTGTTSLQQTMRKNINILRNQGYLYPNLGFDYNHGKIAWGLIQTEQGNKKITVDNLIEKLDQELLADTYHSVILSHEDFCLIKKNNWLKKLQQFFDVQGVIYLRRQDSWLESWYNQHIKWPWDKDLAGATPEQFLSQLDNFFWINYQTLLDNISQALGKENLSINTLDTSGVKDTTQDFLSLIGVEGLETVKEQNASISSAKLDILRRINIFHLKPIARNKIITALKEMDIKEDNHSTAIFSDEQLMMIHQKYLASNRAVAEKYFNRTTLFSDIPTLGRDIALVSDHRAYRIYIPQLLKKVSAL